MSSSSVRFRRILSHVQVSSDNFSLSSLKSKDVEAELNYTGGNETQPDVEGGIIKRCLIANGRGGSHTLERDGFTLSSLPLHLTFGFDLYDPDVCRSKMYPICESAVRANFPECAKVVVFDHIIRSPTRFAQESQPDRSLSGGYAMAVHGDFTVRSGFTRAQFELKSHESQDRINAALSQRFAFINVWVPLKKVERTPLALVEWNSVAPRDVITVTNIFPHRTGAETYRVMHSDSHRWVYYPEMVPGECLVFKQFDSATDGRARIALHSAFEDPTSPASAPIRESMELRCMVFFGDLPPNFADNWPNIPDPVMRPDRVEVGPITDEW